MHMDYRHGMMPTRAYLLGDASTDAQEAAEAAARAGRHEAEISAATAASGAGVAAAARYAYDQALALQKTQAEAAEAARVAAALKKQEQEQYLTQVRQDTAIRALAENKAASEYYAAVRASRMSEFETEPAGKSKLVMVALAAAAAYFMLKG